jgi:hypothetical protein
VSGILSGVSGVLVVERRGRPTFLNFFVLYGISGSLFDYLVFHGISCDIFKFFFVVPHKNQSLFWIFPRCTRLRSPISFFGRGSEGLIRYSRFFVVTRDFSAYF